MNFLADIGATIEVTPGDDIWVKSSDTTTTYLDDRTPFRFSVAGRLMDGQIFYGLYGPVISGPERYLHLTCNIMVRIDGCDWRKERASGANFKVGPGMAERRHEFDFRHPEGTRIAGYPVIGRYGHVEVVDE